jgi:hypothetical protein
MKQLSFLLVMLTVSVSIHAQLIWNGDASNGTGIFKAISTGNVEPPSSITAVNDASRGLIWRFQKPSESNRCENHGIKLNGNNFVFQNNTTYYLGWSTRLSNNTNNNANFQWKSYGNHIQNFPVVLKMINGRLSMLQRQPGPSESIIWSAPFSANTWYHIVVGLHLSDETRGGWVELYFNGVRQTFTNGTQRYACRTFDGGHVCPKWGVYGATGTSISNYIDDLKVGFTYNDVRMPGSGLPSIPVGTTQAENLNLSGFEPNTFEGANAVRALTDAPGFVNGTFSGSTGNYNLTIRYHDENDGAATLRVLVNGTQVGTRTFDVNDHTWKTWTINNVTIGNGQEIRLEGGRQSGEHLRIDHITIAAGSQPITASQTAETGTDNKIDISVFPNPVVNKQTTIRYTLTKAEKVRIAVYNISGQEEVLTSLYQQPGAYAVPWNASGKPTGVYIARIIAGNQVKSVKLTVK